MYKALRTDNNTIKKGRFKAVDKQCKGPQNTTSRHSNKAKNGILEKALNPKK
jgi:hypothetical protein